MNILELIELHAKLSTALVEKGQNFTSKLFSTQHTNSFHITLDAHQIDSVINPVTLDCQVVVHQLGEVRARDVAIYGESHKDTDLDRIVELIIATIFSKHF